MNAGMRRELRAYRAYVVDMDGTLYHQRPVRARMALEMALAALRHPGLIPELRAVATYRKVYKTLGRQEHPDISRAQYEITAERIGSSPEFVQEAVEKWMLKRPLAHIRRYRDAALIEFLNAEHRRGAAVAVYSDYPVRSKIEALGGLDADHALDPSEPGILCLKPNPRGMRRVLEILQIPAREVLMIGDTLEKDGFSARSADVDYLILPKRPSARKRLYRRRLGG